jgi:hypothetical protein
MLRYNGHVQLSSVAGHLPTKIAAGATPRTAPGLPAEAEDSRVPNHHLKCQKESRAKQLYADDGRVTGKTPRIYAASAVQKF